MPLTASIATAERGDQTAIIWEGDDASQSKHITYRELHHDVCRFANVLLDLGIKKGDVVAIYMPMVPEAAVAMLACARIGAIHSVIFGGFSPEAVAGRIIDSNSRLVITSDEGLRAGRAIPLKKNVDDALKNPNVKSIEHVVVLKRTGGKIDWQEGRDLWWSDLIAQASDQHQPEEMNAEDPLFILYTSGSTGKPKGVLHTTGGYGLCRHHLQICLRLPSGRHLLVYCRRRLGDRPQLSAVRPAGLRRRHADV